MSEVVIRIPTPLRTYTGGQDEVRVEATTVREALEALGASHDGLLDSVLDGEGNVRRFVNLYVQDRNITALEGLDTPVEDGAVLSIIPAVAGGAGSALRPKSRRPSRRTDFWLSANFWWLGHRACATARGAGSRTSFLPMSFFR